MDGASQSVNIFYILGLIVVLLYSSDRFNTPETNRLSTTSSKYYTGMVMYLSAYIFFYHVLLLLPELDGYVQSVNPNIAWLPKELVAALVLTILLPALPYVKNFDLSVKTKICNLVNIPYEVSVLVKLLKNSTYKHSDREFETAYDELVGYGFSRNQMDALADDVLLNSWLKITMFKNRLKDCNHSQGYQLFSRIFSSECQRLQDKYDELKSFVLAYVNSSQNGPMKGTEMAREIEKVTHSYLGEIYELIARAVFSRSSVLKNRKKLLEDFGFVIDEPDAQLSWDMISMVFLAVFVLFFAKFILLDRETLFALVLALQIAIFYCIAVFWAVYPKLYWSFASREKGGTRRYSYYLLSTLLTITCVFLVRALVQAVQGADIQTLYTQLMEYMAWQIPSASLVLILSYFLDSRTSLINRWVEGVVGGLLMCIAFAYTVFALDRPLVPVDFIFPFAIGVLVFSYVPHWYRVSLKHVEQPS